MHDNLKDKTKEALMFLGLSEDNINQLKSKNKELNTDLFNRFPEDCAASVKGAARSEIFQLKLDDTEIRLYETIYSLASACEESGRKSFARILQAVAKAVQSQSNPQALKASHEELLVILNALNNKGNQ